ncbi:hypothetical protein BGZ47_010926 [Haplosporangium gracile]|nr:hypothetical protein BGZ47_010926 [Haplosporangium gracile]
MTANPPKKGDPLAGSKLFFSTPEMRESLTKKVISMPDLLTLSSVDRSFRALTSSFIWSYVNFCDATGDGHRSVPPDRFLESQASIRAINENRSAVQTLSTPADFCWIYFEATIGALRSNGPWSVAPARRLGYTPLPLLPLVNLTAFKWEADVTCDQTFHPFTMLGPNRPYLSYLPAAWIISNSPRLVSVSLTGFSCDNSIVARTLIRALSNLSVLKDLNLMAVSAEMQVPLSFTTKLLDCLPASMETLSLVYVIGNAVPAQFAEVPAANDSDAGLAPLKERHGPLSSLLELRLPVFDGTYSTELITRFLRQCPKLITLVLPQPMAASMIPSTGAQLANTIHQHCPQVRNLSILDPVDTAPEDRDAVVAPLNTLSPHHVQSLVWRAFRDNRDHTNLNPVALPPFFPILSRFSSTITTLRMFRVCNMNSDTVKSILSRCEALTTLILRGTTPATYAISLEDAIAVEWACFKLEILDMAVSLSADNSDATLVPGNARWAMFGALARKVGSLTRLKSLTLKATRPYNRQSRSPYPSCFFPGMFTLDLDSSASSSATGDVDRQGFLQVLSSLTHLEELMGSFYHMPHLGFSAAEADWIKNHWKTLRMIEFYPEPGRNDLSANAPQAIRQLKQAMDLRICAYPPVEDD